eukprot:UN00892
MKLLKIRKGSDCKVASFNRSEVKDKIDGCEYKRGDILNTNDLEKAMENITTVIHCSSIIHLRLHVTKKLYSININGTENVIKACKNSKTVKNLIFISSLEAICGLGKDCLNMKEIQKYPPPESHRNEYGYTKRVGEQRVMEANSENLSTVSLRAGFIFGASNPLLLQSWGITSECVLSWVDVKNVANTVVLCCDKIT